MKAYKKGLFGNLNIRYVTDEQNLLENHKVSFYRQKSVQN